MPTSDDACYVRFDGSLLDDGDFCDAGLLNRALGNLNHLADQASQNRIKWVVPSAAQDKGRQVDPDLTRVAGSYFAASGAGICVNWRSPEFDLHVRETGNTYGCRVRLFTKSSHASYFSTFAVALVPKRSTVAEEIVADGVNVATGSPQAATAYWWEDLSPLIYLDASMAGWARESVSTVDTIGGEERGASWLRVSLAVVSKVSNVGAAALLGGVELTEYLEP